MAKKQSKKAAKPQQRAAPDEARATPPYESDFIKLVQSALTKKRAGSQLTREEKRALERYQKDEQERSAKRHYAAIPKKLWVQWSGRSHQILAQQAASWGIPISGPTIDLPAVVLWLHAFLAENAYKLRKRDANEEDGTEAFERRLRLQLQNEVLKFELGEMKGRLIARHEVHDAAAAIASRLRAGLDRLARECGDPALRIMLEALDDAERLIEARWGGEPAEP